jgi:hypothetical protein
MERIRTLLDDWDPDPLTVATWIVKSLTTGAPPDGAESSTASAVRVSVTSFSFWVGFHLLKEEANCTPQDFRVGAREAASGERVGNGEAGTSHAASGPAGKRPAAADHRDEETPS